jgi:hypothetical protein
VQRAYYHCRTCHQGESPWDRQQGLEDGFSPGVKALVVEACGRLPYREAAHLLERAAGLKVEESSQQRIVGAVGERLRAEEAAAVEALFERYEPVEPQGRPERLYVSMDAVKAHTGGEWHDIKAAVVYTATAGEDGSDQAGERQYVAAQEPASAFGRRLYLAAARQGVEAAREVVTLGDGAEWVWNLAEEHYPGSQEILDYWHAAEHVWEVARALYGRESREGARWARKQCRQLKEEGPRKLLTSLARRRPKEEAVQEVVRRELAYFRSHEHRMQYPQYVERGLMIGSGVVEATCKVVVTQRLKHAGMRWSEPGADAVLAIRTTLLNEEFDRLARHCRAN